MAVCQNLVPLVNIKIAGKWMFIPLKMVLIGIDPYPYGFIILNTGRWFVSINGFYKSRGSMCGAGPTLEDHLGQNTRTTLQPLILLIQNPTKAIKPTWNLYVYIYIYTLQTPISNIDICLETFEGLHHVAIPASASTQSIALLAPSKSIKVLRPLQCARTS